MATTFVRLGYSDYQEVYSLQKEIVQKKKEGHLNDDIVLFLEHKSVYTLGKRGGREHLNVTEDFLKERGINVIHIERGGDITYHGKGQIVVYPLLDIKRLGLSVMNYVTAMESVMIKTAADFGISAKNDERNRGAWVDGRKLGSVGITVQRGITFHGLALNVNPDLRPFTWINPCGLKGVIATSLREESGEAIHLDTAYARIIENCAVALGIEFEMISPEVLRTRL